MTDVVRMMAVEYTGSVAAIMYGTAAVLWAVALRVLWGLFAELREPEQ